MIFGFVLLRLPEHLVFFDFPILVIKVFEKIWIWYFTLKQTQMKKMVVIHWKMVILNWKMVFFFKKDCFSLKIVVFIEKLSFFHRFSFFLENKWVLDEITMVLILYHLFVIVPDLPKMFLGAWTWLFITYFCPVLYKTTKWLCVVLYCWTFVSEYSFLLAK